jgi:hypothetical protein
MYSALQPSLTVFQNQLFCAYVSSQDQQLYLISRDAGSNTWNGPGTSFGVVTDTSPTIAADPTGHYLILAYKKIGSQQIYVTYSEDGVNWSEEYQVGNNLTQKVGPTLLSSSIGAVFMIYMSKNSSNVCWLKAPLTSTTPLVQAAGG